MENQQTMRISPSENEEKTPVTGYDWVVFFVANVAAFVCGLNFMKNPTHHARSDDVFQDLFKQRRIDDGGVCLCHVDPGSAVRRLRS